MKPPTSQTSLVGFTGHNFACEEVPLKTIIKDELVALKELFGAKITTVSSLISNTDISFLNCCIELRIPTILILPSEPDHLSKSFTEEEWSKAKNLMSVSLACYIAPGDPSKVRTSSLVLEWADILLCVTGGFGHHCQGESEEALGDATALGIPSRVIDVRQKKAHWSFNPDPNRGARHGFDTRRKLLEFFDYRLGAPITM